MGAIWPLLKIIIIWIFKNIILVVLISEGRKTVGKGIDAAKNSRKKKKWWE